MTTSVRPCRSFRTSPTRSRSSVKPVAPATPTFAWSKSVARSAISNRCLFSKRSASLVSNSAAIKRRLRAPDTGALHRDLCRRSRPSRPSTRSRNCARSVSSRTSSYAARKRCCRMNNGARLHCLPTFPRKRSFPPTTSTTSTRSPQVMHAQGLGDIVADQLRLDLPPANLD